MSAHPAQEAALLRDAAARLRRVELALADARARLPGLCTEVEAIRSALADVARDPVRASPEH